MLVSDIFCQQLRNICKLNWYIGIGYILPVIGEYMLNFFIGICYILPTIWGYLSIGGCRVAEYALKKNELMHNLQPCAWRGHKHPIIDIFLPIVGRIYPIQEYIQLFIYSLIAGSIYPIQIYEIQFAAKKFRGPICHQQIFRGPICRQGAQSAGARFAGAQSAGAQFAGAQFAIDKISGAQYAGAQFAGARFAIN